MEATAISINNGRSEKHLQDHISELPNDILIRIIELTSPLDACRVSAVSTKFQSAAESDELWMHFLPSDLSSILFGAKMDVHQHLPLRKKELYLYLCRNWIRFDGGLKSFSLDVRSGTKKIMLHEAYFNLWDLNDDTLSTYTEGIICFKDLSPQTNYAAYLLFTGTPYNQYGNRHDRYLSLVAWEFVGLPNLKNLRTRCLKVREETQMRDDGRWEIGGMKFYTYFEGYERLYFLFNYNNNFVGGDFLFEGLEMRPTD